jgi:flagellar motor switch protein FliM
MIFADMQDAWSNVTRISIEYLNSEINPQFANIVSPTESVVVSEFHIELDGGSGTLQLAMPSTMLEPVRELLDAGVVSDRIEHDDRWVQSLKEEIEEAEVELRLVLGRGQVTLAELLNLKPGDVVPFDFGGRARRWRRKKSPCFAAVMAFRMACTRSRLMNASCASNPRYGMH